MAAHHLLLILLTVSRNEMSMTLAQQSAAGQDTLIGIVGRDFVMMGADSSSSGGGIALKSSDIDKIAVIHDGKSVFKGNDGNEDVRGQSWEQQAIAVGVAGDAADGKPPIRFICNELTCRIQFRMILSLKCTYCPK